MRADQHDVYRALGEADGGLHHGEVRLGASAEQRVRHFQEELEQLKARLLEMGGLAEEQVRLAGKGLGDRDRDLIARVLLRDGPPDSLHIGVDNRCFTLLALYQPMAVDLRAIVAAVK